MQAFTTFTGIVLPLDRANVDTDAIIPKQYLKSIKRSGFGVNLFDDWRYLDHGNPGDDHSKRRINPDFVINLPRYKNAGVLLTRKNFGCGSSREHAVWALMDHGIRAVVAPSFADIFLSNCFKNGLLPITLPESDIDELFRLTFDNEGYQLSINLEAQTVTTPEDNTISFEIDAGLKNRMLQGLDEIGMTLQYANAIKSYEQKQSGKYPWLFPDLK